MKRVRVIPHDVMISPSDNGWFIVQVGYVRLAYTSRTDLLQDLGEYLDNPEEVLKDWATDIPETTPSPETITCAREGGRAS
jgi:hypothetical protein